MTNDERLAVIEEIVKRIEISVNEIKDNLTDHIEKDLGKFIVIEQKMFWIKGFIGGCTLLMCVLYTLAKDFIA